MLVAAAAAVVVAELAGMSTDVGCTTVGALDSSFCATSSAVGW